jgi:hypothetical protein
LGYSIFRNCVNQATIVEWIFSQEESTHTAFVSVQRFRECDKCAQSHGFVSSAYGTPADNSQFILTVKVFPHV